MELDKASLQSLEFRKAKLLYIIVLSITNPAVQHLYAGEI